MDCGLPSSSSSKSSLVRSRTILPFLSRTVTGKVTTFTLTGIVVTGAAGLWVPRARRAAGYSSSGIGALEPEEASKIAGGYASDPCPP